MATKKKTTSKTSRTKSSAPSSSRGSASTTRKKTLKKKAAVSRAAGGTTKKKTAAKKAAARKTAAKKTVAKKTAVKKTAAKKTAAKKKSATRKQAAATKKKTTGRVASKKKATPSSKKTTSGKTEVKKSVAKKSTSKKKTTAAAPKGKAASATNAKKKSTRRKTSGKAAASPGTANGTAHGSKSAKGRKSAGAAKDKPKSSIPIKKTGRSVAEIASLAQSEADEKGYVFINGRRVRLLKTRAEAVAKKRKRSRTVAKTVEAAPEVKKPVKTKLTKKDLQKYRDLLMERRRELLADLMGMESAALRSNGGEISHMPIHMADIGTDTYDQDFMLGMAENERKRLREIDDALMRIKDGTYGVCQMTGQQIPKARLNAKPWAKYTIEAARMIESGIAPPRS